MEHIDFDIWRRRPVYVAQCRSWSRAAELGLTHPRFRARPEYRNNLARMSRVLVALSLRAERQASRAAV